MSKKEHNFFAVIIYGSSVLLFPRSFYRQSVSLHGCNTKERLRDKKWFAIMPVLADSEVGVWGGGESKPATAKNPEPVYLNV